MRQFLFSRQETQARCKSWVTIKKPRKHAVTQYLIEYDEKAYLHYINCKKYLKIYINLTLLNNECLFKTKLRAANDTQPSINLLAVKLIANFHFLKTKLQVVNIM